MSFPLYPKNANESMSESDTSSKKTGGEEQNDEWRFAGNVTEVNSETPVEKK